MASAVLARVRWRAAAGLTLVELLVVIALVALGTTVAVGALQSGRLKSGRLDAVEALTRVQMAQEQHRSAHGLYASEWSALVGVGPTSPQGLYTLALQTAGGEAYRAVATARGAQAADTDCAAITLEVRQGFAQPGPAAACWNR